MAVRLAHVAGQPAEADHIGTGLVGIAKEHGGLLRAGGIADELDLVRLLELYGFGIELAL